MNKILEKMYSEKDISTNISIFIGSTVALIVYYFTNDTYLSLILSVGTFAICKVIFDIIIKKILRSKDEKRNLRSYSKAEKGAIDIFLSKGTTSVIFEDIDLSPLIDGFRSLESRNKAKFIYNPTTDSDAGPIGIILSEDVFTLFLKK